MSIFRCYTCDNFRDSDFDGECIEGPDFSIICGECANEAQAESEEADDRRRDNPLEPDFRRIDQ